MSDVVRLLTSGNTLVLVYDDGTRRPAYKAPGGTWYVGGSGGSNPDPDPEPSGEWFHPLGEPWPWTTYEDGGGSHSAGALDFPCGADTPPLYAAYAGEVIYAGWEDGGGGNVVVIRGPDGEGITYAHLSSIDVSVGQVVSLGQKVGNVGSTGNSTGNHLHLEVRRNGTVWGSWYRAYDYFNARGIDLGPQVG